MKSIISTTVTALTAAALGCIATPSFADVQLNETYSIEIQRLNVNLDNGKRAINVTATWKFKPNPTTSDYIDSNVVLYDIKNFLADYPSKTDFWEVINHKLALFLIGKYKTISSIAVKLDVPASKSDAYEHYTLVEATR